MSDTPAAVAFDDNAPAAERLDANTQLTKANMPASADLLPPAHIREIIEHIQNDLADQQMHKAQIIPFPGAGARKRSQGMQSMYIDDLQVSVMGDYYEKPGAIPFDAMRQMVEQAPVLSAVVLTRARQMSEFCRPAQSDDGPGFKIRHIDKDHKLTNEEQESSALLTRFFLNCGWEFNPRRRRALRRDNLTQFVMKMVRDSLTMDSAPIETEMKRDRTRGPDGFYALDGSTIRLCTEQGYEGDDSIYALQVVQGRVVTSYTLDDLIYEPRNPRTEVTMAGYGLSETELLVRTVTGFLNAMTLNIKGFSENSIPRGILHLVGDFKEQDLNAFKRYWNSMCRGVGNAWALPVLATKDKGDQSSFEQIDAGFNEMYFSKWMTFLTSIICAIYGMSPDEINFESFTTGSRGLGGADVAEKLASSKDKGFKPLARYVEQILSDFICSEFSDKYVLRFTGLDDEDLDKKHELRKLSSTLDEVRSILDMKPIGGDLGGAPINPSLNGVYMQQLQQKQQDFGDPYQAGSDFGDPDEKAGKGEDEDGAGAGGAGDDDPNAGADGQQDAPAPGEAKRAPRQTLNKALPPPVRPGWTS